MPKKKALPVVATTTEEVGSIVAAMRAEFRSMDDFRRADVRLMLQIKAIKRRNGSDEAEGEDRTDNADDDQCRPVSLTDLIPGEDAVTFLLEKARLDSIVPHRKYHLKELTELTTRLPVCEWVDGVRGFGVQGLGEIIAQTGDLWYYSDFPKVWKRMGLSVMPDGTRQRKFADKDKAIEAGYSPTRRALMHVVGESLIKQNGEDGRYRGIYNWRKELELATLPDEVKKGRAGWAHKRAMRYMEKQLLRDLWKEWRRVTPAPQEESAA